MKIEKNIFILAICCLLSTSLLAQEITVIDEDLIIEQTNSDLTNSDRQGVSLVQNGNQNTAQLIQVQSFSSQLSLYQQGNFNSARMFQHGSGNLNVIQNGEFNHVINFLAGESMDIEYYQEGQANTIRQFSIGDNSTYQFIQLGNENTINHLNFRGNDQGLFIQQRGNNMGITIYTR